MGRLPERLAFRRRHARRRPAAEITETRGRTTDAEAPVNVLRVEFGSLLFDLIRYDLTDEITSDLSHLFDELVEYGCMERPSVMLLENETLRPYEFILCFSGEYMGMGGYNEKGKAHKQLPHDVRNMVQNWLFRFLQKSKLPENFISKKEKENSREACLFLYRYFREVENDGKRAFHWLKKLSAFGVPGDLRMLSIAYRIGDGCRKDKYLSDKYYIALGKLLRQQRDLF